MCIPRNSINESLIHDLTNYTRHPSRLEADSRIIPALPWDKRMQGHILASFFYGYILTQIPGGWLSFRYGAKGVLAGGLALVSICTLISPPLARLNPYAFMLARFGQGLGEGVMPATHSMISKWSPPHEENPNDDHYIFRHSYRNDSRSCASSPEEWRRVFIFSAFILTVGAVFFIFAASGIEQRWSTTRKAYEVVEDGKKESRQE
ncbi:unnamed protein product [Gordionus sp. m RMFG-2023]